MTKSKSKKHVKIVMTVVICITVLEIVALLKGINGTMLRTVLILLAALTGLTLPTPKAIKIWR